VPRSPRGQKRPFCPWLPSRLPDETPSERNNSFTACCRTSGCVSELQRVRFASPAPGAGSYQVHDRADLSAGRLRRWRMRPFSAGGRSRAPAQVQVDHHARYGNQGQKERRGLVRTRDPLAELAHSCSVVHSPNDQVKFDRPTPSRPEPSE